MRRAPLFDKTHLPRNPNIAKYELLFERVGSPPSCRRHAELAKHLA